MGDLMRRAALLSLAGWMLCGCPGNLDRPERFFMDAGVCPDVEQTIFIPTCGGSGCHENPGAANNLDLVSPGVAGRLATGLSTCQGKPLRTFMLTKLSGPPGCGAQMPLGADPLSADQLMCITEYLAALDGGM